MEKIIDQFNLLNWAKLYFVKWLQFVYSQWQPYQTVINIILSLISKILMIIISTILLWFTVLILEYDT